MGKLDLDELERRKGRASTILAMVRARSYNLDYARDGGPENNDLYLEALVDAAPELIRRARAYERLREAAMAVVKLADDVDRETVAAGYLRHYDDASSVGRLRAALAEEPQ